MRIIHVNKYFCLRDGVGRYMLGLMKLQEQAGHQVVPFAMHYPKNNPSPWSGYFVSELKTESGVSHPFRLVHRALWSREAKRNMARLIQDFKPDVVHVHNIYTHLSPSVLAACHEAGVPVVMSVHDYALVSTNYSLWNRGQPMDLNHLGLFATARTRFIKGSFLATFVLDVINRYHRLRGFYRKYVDVFLANSQFTAELLECAGISSEHTQVMYPFLDEALLQEQEGGSDDGSVVYFGRLVDYKGVDVLIDAMRTFPQTPLRIVGSGPQEQELRERAQDMPNVRFDGFLANDQLWDVVRRARVVVVPSLWYEPFGLTALEAMALTRPVIVSDRGGLPEIVEDDVSGRIVPAGDVERLAEALKSFLYDATYASSLGEAARGRALEIGDPERHAKRMLKIYQQVMR